MTSKLIAVVGLSALIVLHELGHFLLARLFGMRVERFSIGFGPALLKRRFGATVWQLAAFPLGGYVQIHGMGPPAENERPGAFATSRFWQREFSLSSRAPWRIGSSPRSCLFRSPQP
ncbi:MAG: site-2 protease family protein [Myxococcota bacterium]